ncbi:peptidyl-dipeptidase A [Sorangium cellulosum]|uniref:Peptidyl-dipeptidase A n=1 Tax=Sorangium cellulosum TaxID=56 RepID=A0A2L0EZR7_SORCE|nr:peptidyl-dipeptidase A [Sorangium cellulosum]
MDPTSLLVPSARSGVYEGPVVRYAFARTVILPPLVLAALGLGSGCSGAASPPADPPCPSAEAPAGPEAAAAPAAPAAPRAAPSGPAPPSPAEAQVFLAGVDRELRRLRLQAARAAWVNQTFITDDTDAISASAEEESMEYLTRTMKAARRFDGLALPGDLARQLSRLKISTTLPAPSDPAERAELAALSVDMMSLYGKGKYCPPGKAERPGTARPGAQAAGAPRCLAIDELSDILKTSRKWDELLEAWTGWHAIAPPMRPKFERYVALGNKGAAEIGFADVGALWRAGYDMPPDAFEAEAERLWGKLKPLYDELHCHVRARLRGIHGKDRIGEKAPIPAHLLGNMWAQDWSNVYALMEPYKGQPSLDVTRKLKAQKLDEKRMVALGERFFTSLGFDPLPATFWERSLLKKPADREVVCHPSAWDVGDRGDLRLKMCTEITEEDLLTVHHELGHVYYYHQYHELPILFQAGANDGFHEGIGDTLALSVTPAYLKTLGLIDRVPEGEKGIINFLFKQALDKVAFLPFGKLIDQWRWDVFSGKTRPADYNKAWWALRLRYQGVAPPVPRTEADFDPGAKYHVPANTPYTQYFLARIYQFQFHRALCKAAGHTGPLHACSIYGNQAAGEKLRAMLSLGASRPWQEALRAMTGESEADPGAMLEYFEPLWRWLKEQNKGEVCGW